MVRAGVVGHPAKWDWCGYRELAGRLGRGHVEVARWRKTSRAPGARRESRHFTGDFRGGEIASKPSERPPKIRIYSLSNEYVPITHTITT